MECTNCDGSGHAPKNDKLPCFICGGSGSCCDICGEACEEDGQDICDRCAEEAD